MNLANSEERPLKHIASSFRDLASILTDNPNKVAHIQVAPFTVACSHVSVLFGCLGFAFKFAEKDYVAKVKDLSEASKSHTTLQSLLEFDIQNDCVRKGGSHTRNLLRVKRGLDMVKVFFEKILATDGNSLRDQASEAYTQVFSAHHVWPIRKAVSAGLYSLPTKSQLLTKLNEEESSAREQMQTYVEASDAVIKYIENLYLSRNLGIDW